MKITVITGTDTKGCTYHIKETFLDVLREGNIIEEFSLPKDMPHFCIGCKNCFLRGEEFCPHFEYVSPIFESMKTSDLILFAYPVYALRAPGHVKALLDHLCYNWVIHRPKEELFTQEIAILSQSIGAPNGAAQKDVATSMNWMGNSNIRRQGFGLMEGIVWEELSDEKKNKIVLKTRKFAEYYLKGNAEKQGAKGKFLFNIGKTLRKNVLKGEKKRSIDTQYWIDKGWIKE